MKPSDIRALEQVLDAVFQAENHKLLQIRQEEQAILDALAALRAAGPVKADTQISTMQRLGADLVWQAWSGARQSGLNAELARLRVQKEAEKERLRTAFGRREAVRLLSRSRV